MARRRVVEPIYPYNPLEEYQDESIEEIKKNKPDGLLRIVFALVLITTVCTAVLLFKVIVYVYDLAAYRNEQSSLLELTENFESDSTNVNISEFDMSMREINPDYISWINIEGTVINYPVVRGNDNDKYLNTSFYGEINTFGTLFMDYRCIGEYVPHIIIYGHNMKTGNMFGSLRNYLDEQYLAEHSIITLKINDRIVEYEVFAARKTDINDIAYNLDFSEPGSFQAFAKKSGAPSDSAQILTLSTCVSGNDKDERIIVQAQLRQS